MKTKKTLLRFILLIVGILILVNIASDSYFFRLDFTADKRYTLSNATLEILHSMKQPVTVKAYFSEDVPLDVAKVKRDFKELLIEYANRSKGKIVYEFINPNGKEELENQAMQAGVQPVMIQVREKDQMKQQKAYIGAMLQMGDKTDVIPVLQPGAAMEYALSSSIKKISISDKPVVGILQGHGEPGLQSIRQVYAALSVLYTVEPVTLSDTAPIPDHIRTLAIIDPKDSFPMIHLQRLEEFYAKGKNIFIAYGHLMADFSTAQGSTRNTGIEQWLESKGIKLEDQFIVDVDCGAINVQQNQGGFIYNTPMQFPYFPKITKFGDHQITKGIEQITLQFPCPIKYTGDSSMQFVSFLKSGLKTGTQPAPTYFNIQKQWTENDFPLQGLTIGAAVSGKGSARSKMVIISTGSFATNGEGQQAQQLPPDNVNLMVNSIDWLSDDTGLIDLRTKGVTSRPLNATEDATKTFYKFLNFLLPILVIVIYGFVRAQHRRMERIRRMEESYV